MSFHSFSNRKEKNFPLLRLWPGQAKEMLFFSGCFPCKKCAYNEPAMSKRKTIRLLYLLYAIFGLFFLALSLVRLFLYLYAPAQPAGVNEKGYRTLFFLKEGIEILIASSFLDYGVYGTIHKEGRTKASYYVPLWFMGVGDSLLYLLSGIAIPFLATPEEAGDVITSFLYAHFFDPVYLFSLAGAIFLIRAFQREERGRPYLKQGYIGLAFLFPLFVYDFVMFCLASVNSLAGVPAIVFGSLFYLFRLLLWILAFFALSETDD